MFKKLLLVLLAAFTLFGCSQASEEAETTSTNQSTSQAADQADHEDHDHDHAEHDEKYADVEEVVIAITEDGYVTLHGDHPHSYSGPVPEDALISKDLFTEEDGEVISEHKAGQVVKVADKYLFKASEEDSEYYRDIDASNVDLDEDHDHDHDHADHEGHDHEGHDHDHE